MIFPEIREHGMPLMLIFVVHTTAHRKWCRDISPHLLGFQISWLFRWKYKRSSENTNEMGFDVQLTWVMQPKTLLTWTTLRVWLGQQTCIPRHFSNAWNSDFFIRLGVLADSWLYSGELNEVTMRKSVITNMLLSAFFCFFVVVGI